MSLITIIGRGHSGTRAISHTLYVSNVYMGDLLNASGDLLPPQAMYEACRVIARYVQWKGDLNWDFSDLHSMDIPSQFTDLLHLYLRSVLTNRAEHKGWKIPETTLIYPWLVRLYPDIHYIFWVRNPRDCILGQHLTDDLSDFGVEYPRTDDLRLRRAISWKYQYDIVRATPRPAKWIEIRFEDFVQNQEETVKRLESFLGIPLARIITRADSIGRWKHDDGVNYFDFLEPMMREYGYEIPEAI
jgi:Sulfotransferase family